MAIIAIGVAFTLDIAAIIFFTSVASIFIVSDVAIAVTSASAWLVVALLVSIAAAHVFYVFVEAPSVRFVKRLKHIRF